MRNQCRLNNHKMDHFLSGLILELSMKILLCTSAWACKRAWVIGLVDPATVITTLQPPHKVGNMFGITEEEMTKITSFMKHQ